MLCAMFAETWAAFIAPFGVNLSIAARILGSRP
jgi:hypothetical protein